jgi:RNA polymerase sigma factor (sigma-70 family)
MHKRKLGGPELQRPAWSTCSATFLSNKPNEPAGFHTSPPTYTAALGAWRGDALALSLSWRRFLGGETCWPMLLRREYVQTVNGSMQLGRTAADKRKPAVSTTRYIEFTPPNSALDQVGLLVQNRLPSEDDSIARFKQNIVPQLDAAYNFARFLSRDVDAAQDIVQEAFLRAYRSFAGYRGGDARAWIFAIVRNCYHSRLMDRRRKSRLEVDPKGNGDSEEVILNISSDEDTPEAMLVRKAESQTVRFILNMMPRALREILVLRELEELSYRQIAEITALPIGTVMSRLARARKAFGDAWGCEEKNTG